MDKIIKSSQFDVASRILLSRMIKPTTIDVAILDRETLSPGKRVNFANICNRYIGCFDQRVDGKLCFYLAARQHPDSDITHLFIYYVNTGYKVIQDIDIDRLKMYIPNLTDDDCSMKIGIVEATCSAHPANYLSVLIEAIDFTIGHLLIENYVPLQIINADRGVCSSPFGSSQFYGNDSISPAFASELKRLADRFCISFHLLNGETEVTEPGIGFIQVENQSVGYIYHRETQLVSYLLTHSGQFKDSPSYAIIKQHTLRCFSKGIRGFYCSRLVTNESIRPNDKLVYLMFKVALILSPHIMVVVNENDLLCLDEVLDELLSKSTGSFHPSISTQQAPVSASQDYSDPNQVATPNSRELIFVSQNQPFEQSQLSNSSFDSNATDVIDDQEIQVELRLWSEVSLGRQKIRDSIVPPIHLIKPSGDLSRTYLKCFPSYQEAISCLGNLWNRYVATIVYPKVACRLDREPVQTDKRFSIYPVETTNGDDCLVIVDQSEKEWIYLKPDNMAHKEGSYFDTTCRYILLLFPELQNYTRRPVIITSVFHEDYPKVHLLMSVYVISRLFRYAIQLPQKIIYGEWEFRKYASNICSELQFVNSRHNIEQGLYVRGHLKAGALISYPSPLLIEPKVVPKDQCMFCKKRGFKQLGAHYSMRHGGNAMKANRGRLTFE